MGSMGRGYSGARSGCLGASERWTGMDGRRAEMTIGSMESLATFSLALLAFWVPPWGILEK